MAKVSRSLRGDWTGNWSNCTRNLKRIAINRAQYADTGSIKEEGSSDRWESRQYGTEWCRHPFARCWSRSSKRSSAGTVMDSGRSEAVRMHWREVQRRLEEGYHWVVDADIEKYFDCIVPEILMQEVEKEVSDGRVLKLIRSYLEQEVLDGMKKWKPERGTPQGAVISPLLANLYLHPVDEEMERARYADDGLILCRDEQQAREALRKLRKELAQRGITTEPEQDPGSGCPPKGWVRLSGLPL